MNETVPPKGEDAASKWYHWIVENPKQALRYALLFLAFVGYDLTIPANRASDALTRLGDAQQKVDDAFKKIDELEKTLDEIRRKQDTQIKLAEAKR